MTNVLIVDAERVIRSTLKERLEYEGYVVDTAQSRSEATGKLERSAFDVMLCDISLPEKDALDLLSVAHDSCPDLPVIMLSKLKGLDVAIDCIRRGAYDYIEKPIDLNKLLNSIRDSLQVKSQNRATKQSSGPEVIQGINPLSLLVTMRNFSGRFARGYSLRRAMPWSGPRKVWFMSKV